jgi:hypothetical protein
LGLFFVLIAVSCNTSFDKIKLIMSINSCFALIFLLFLSEVDAQDASRQMSLGFYCGVGKEIKNKNYSYSNRYFKFQFCNTIKESKKYKYEFSIQPQVDFAQHQLLNLYYITPDSSGYLEKREEFGKLKDIRNYSVSFGLIISRSLSEWLSVFVLASVGPMITDTETERLSRGFTFSDVLSLGFSFKIYNAVFEIRPNFSHLSNAGLQKRNGGFNSINLEFGLNVPL